MNSLFNFRSRVTKTF